MLFLAAALASCSESVPVGDGTEVVQRGADNEAKQLAQDLRGEWYGNFPVPDSLGSPVPMLLTLRAGPGPRSLYFKLRCATTSSCPLPDPASFAPFFSPAAEADAGFGAGEFPEIELQVFEAVDDASVRPNAVLLVNVWIGLPLRVWLNPERSMLHFDGPEDDQRAVFTRTPSPETDGGSNTVRSSE